MQTAGRRDGIVGPFTCTARRTAQALAFGQMEPVYRYYFSYHAPNGATDPFLQFDTRIEAHTGLRTDKCTF